jgi:hypothetical protein
MLYLEVTKLLKKIITFLKNNKIPIPDTLVNSADAFDKALSEGGNVSKENLDTISRYLFPEYGMGWYADLGYELGEEKMKELNILTQELQKAIQST